MSKLEKKGQNGHFFVCLSDTKDKTRIVLVFFKNQSQKRGKTRESSSSGVFEFF